MASKKKTTKTKKRPVAKKKPAKTKKAAAPARAKVAKRLVSRQQPESLRLRAAAPSLTVADVEASLAWYHDVLGFTTKDRWEEDGTLTGVEMVAGNVTFYIGQDDWKKGRDRVKGEGFRLYCTTVQDIDALAAQVKARGETLLEEPHDMSWGGRSFAVTDPDGFRITITSD
jgi:uncharacterized glyoxalase superfamily protein PhnB